MVITLVGDSIAQGLGVLGSCYADLLAREFAQDGNPATVHNRAYTAYQISDSAKLMPEIVADRPDIVLVAHGITEAVIRPRPESLRHVPRRWRMKGWLDPRPYFSRRPHRRLAQQLESAIRWRVKVRLMRRHGGQCWTSADDYERQCRAFVVEVLAQTGARVLLLSHTPIDERFFPGTPASFALYRERTRRVAAELAPTGRVAYCDLTTALETWADFFADHFHPNHAGHVKLAHRIAVAIRDLERRPLATQPVPAPATV